MPKVHAHSRVLCCALDHATHEGCTGREVVKAPGVVLD